MPRSYLDRKRDILVVFVDVLVGDVGQLMWCCRSMFSRCLGCKQSLREPECSRRGIVRAPSWPLTPDHVQCLVPTVTSLRIGTWYVRIVAPYLSLLLDSRAPIPNVVCFTMRFNLCNAVFWSWLAVSSVHAANSLNISQPLFESLEELARIVDISYCVGSTGIHKPFSCLSRCSELEGFELVTVSDAFSCYH